MNEHDTEPVPGLPARLPDGEHILWQGAPAWRSLARQAFHVGQVAIYFALLLVWSTTADILGGAGALDVALSTGKLLGLAAVALSLLCTVAWLTQRTTVYTITNRRVVMRFGIALPITFNLPFKRIAGAGLKAHGDTTGDITLTLQRGERLAYFVLWPHARPWKVAPAEPMLRAIADAARVGQILSRALAAASDQPAPVPSVAAVGSQRHSAPATA